MKRLKNTEKYCKRLQELVEISGISVAERRGGYRVVIGKKITGKDRIEKICVTEDEAITYIESWVYVRKKKSESAMRLSDHDIEDADAAISLLRSKSVTLTLLEVCRKYVDNMPASKPLKIEKLVEIFLAAQEKSGRVGDRHYKQLQYTYDSLLDVFTGRLVHEIFTDEFEDYLDEFYGLKAPKTYNNHRANLNSLLAFSVKKKAVKSNPITTIEKKKVGGKSVEILTPDEVFDVLSVARSDYPKVCIALALQAFAGVRGSEVLRLKWGDIVGDYVVISANVAKTDSRRTIPILPPLKAILVDYLGMPKDKPIFSSSIRMFDEWRRQSASKAGVTWKRNCLRHSFVSYRLINTRDESLTALEAGHSSDILRKHYKALVADEDVEAKRYWNLFTENVISIKNKKNAI